MMCVCTHPFFYQGAASGDSVDTKYSGHLFQNGSLGQVSVMCVCERCMV